MRKLGQIIVIIMTIAMVYMIFNYEYGTGDNTYETSKIDITHWGDYEKVEDMNTDETSAAGIMKLR